MLDSGANAVSFPPSSPERSWIGALARTLAETLPAREPRRPVAGHVLELRGHAAVVLVQSLSYVQKLWSGLSYTQVSGPPPDEGPHFHATESVILMVCQ